MVIVAAAVVSILIVSDVLDLLNRRRTG